MHHIHLSQPLDLDHTLNSGQVFRWHKKGNMWEGIVNEQLIQIFQNDHVYCTGDEEFFYTYFRLDDDLGKILSSIDKDRNIHKAIATVYGLRLVRQDPWECLLSFVCSSFNNVPRIKLIIENLCKKFGKKLECGYAFPPPEALACASLKQLRKCGLGYRDKYVSETAQIIDSGLSLQEIGLLSYGKAKELLMELPGVGQKVADCILLFSLDKLEAFPCDVNIRKCMNHFYGPCSNIGTFARKYFGEYAGYANHYLFHYHRLTRLR
jgi:N-glycosylase/DNA lyase